MMKGLSKTFLFDLIHNNVSDESFLRFCKSYISFNKVKKNRIFPRISKTPFTKWYVKQYSISSDYDKIFKAIKNNDFSKLNKNLKTKATKILKIDGVNCADYVT